MNKSTTTPAQSLTPGTEPPTTGDRAFWNALLSLKQASVAQLSLNELNLERCRLAAEWRQTVQEQGSLLLTTIRLKMLELNRLSQEAPGLPGVPSSGSPGALGSIPLDLLEEHKRRLCEDISQLVKANASLDASIRAMSAVLVDVESHSQQVVAASERIRANPLVRNLMPEGHGALQV